MHASCQWADDEEAIILRTNIRTTKLSSLDSCTENVFEYEVLYELRMCVCAQL